MRIGSSADFGIMIHSQYVCLDLRANQLVDLRVKSMRNIRLIRYAIFSKTSARSSKREQERTTKRASEAACAQAS
jgi:hypothetical protein